MMWEMSNLEIWTTLYAINNMDRDKFQLLELPEYYPSEEYASGDIRFTGAYVRAFGEVFVICCVKRNVVDDPVLVSRRWKKWRTFLAIHLLYLWRTDLWVGRDTMAGGI
jgi:hypothetical protein